MGSTKEGIMVVLDVGLNMQAPAPGAPGGDSFLDLARDSLQWIVSRKIFTESKDEVGLILLGTEETKNPVAEKKEDGYENIYLAHSLQTTDFKLLEFAQKDVEPGPAQADYLEGLEVALEALVDSTEGRKFAGLSIVLLSNLGGGLNPSSAALSPKLAGALKEHGVELKVIGPNLPPQAPADGTVKNEPGDEDDGEKPGPSAANGAGPPHNGDGCGKRSAEMVEGEAALQELLAQGVDGETYTLMEANQVLARFASRSVKPTPWKANLSFGHELDIPVTMFGKVRESKLKQTWRKTDAADPSAKVAMERIYKAKTPAAQADGKLDLKDEQVEKEDLVKGYRFGSTCVPFTETEKAMLHYKSPGKVFQMVGFAKAEEVKRRYFLGEAVSYVTGDAGDAKGCRAFSALVKAMAEDGTVGIVRYCHSARSSPRLCALFPKESSKGADVLVFVQLPFSEDIRPFVFPAFTERSRPSDSELEAVDDLIDAMDLGGAAVDEDGQRTEALKPSATVNPYHQYLFHCLRSRALDPDAPLAPPAPAVLAALDPPAELANLAKMPLAAIAKAFPLTRTAAAKKDKRSAKELYQAGEGPSAKVAKTDGGEEEAKWSVGSVRPVEDFEKWVLARPADFAAAAAQLAQLINDFAFKTLGDELNDKALSCVESWRECAVQFGEAKGFNAFLVELKDAAAARPDFWRRLKGHKGSLGLILGSEAGGGATKEEAAAFEEAPSQPTHSNTASTAEDDLLDELE